jgi:hypothetical protein
MWFPACVSVAGCGGANGESVSFFRNGATNVFSVRLTAQGKTLAPPLSSGAVMVTFSLDGATTWPRPVAARSGGASRLVAGSCRVYPLSAAPATRVPARPE